MEEIKIENFKKVFKINLVFVIGLAVIAGLGLGYFLIFGDRSVHECEKTDNDINRDACYFNTAEETLKDGFCDKISDKNTLKDICYIRVAKQLKNRQPCEKIAEAAKKFLCYAVAVNDSNACGESADADSRDMCYFEFAVKTQDSGLCERITPGETKDRCFMFSGQ